MRYVGGKDKIAKWIRNTVLEITEPYPPLLFNDADDAQRTIDRFHIPDAKLMRWGR